MSAHAETAPHSEASSEIVTRNSDHWINATILGTAATLASYYLLKFSAVNLPAGLAGSPVNLALSVGSGFLGTAIGIIGAGRGGAGENLVNIGSAVMSVISPIVAPAWNAISNTIHTLSTAFGMRHLYRHV